MTPQLSLRLTVTLFDSVHVNNHYFISCGMSCMPYNTTTVNPGFIAIKEVLKIPWN